MQKEPCLKTGFGVDLRGDCVGIAKFGIKCNLCPRNRPVFSGQKVGIKEVENNIWLVSFMDYDLGYFDGEVNRVEMGQNPFVSKVLPMSSE